MPQSLANVLVHLVFSTKHREPTISLSLIERLDPYMAGIASNFKCPAIRIGGVEDHTHGLFVLHPTVSIAELVGTLKSNSSRWVHETFSEHALFGWQAGYGVFSVSASARDAVVRYIENQPIHHANRSFQDEFLMLLDRHGLSHDPRYVWD
jgi:putative transposase